MSVRSVATALLLYFSIVTSGFAQTGVTKEDYLTVIKEAEERIWQDYEASYESWQKSDASAREKNPPKPNIHWGRLDGLLYAVTGDNRYAKRVRKVLLEAPWYDNYYAILIIKQIKSSGVLGADDLKAVNRRILDKAEKDVQYWVEWGAMNHCSDIVNGLTAVMKYFPRNPAFSRWKQKRDINLSGSWGRWSIEDSHNYIPPWLKPIMQSVELEGWEKRFYDMPTTRYYFDYFVQLMTPGGQIVKFGDGGEGGDYTWPWYVSVLEKGASVYHDGKMKWAAHRLFQSNVHEKGMVYLFTVKDLVEAYLWADDSIPEEIPNDASRLVLEDYVGKKVVFRSGWEPKATYLFLNYLDDAPFGIDGKEHMINTINVETEKNHHGQADENAICFFMKDGSVLLHDSGYRETESTGPDGQYRADVYHNKLIVRSGLADPQMRLLPFLLDGGRYRFVRTRLMHFRRFKEVDISRTRLTDEDRGYQWDRLINYLKGREWFVIFDIVKVLKDGPYTLANFFYTQDIVDYDQKSRSWYDTRYRTIGTSLQSGGFARKPTSLLLNPDNYIYANEDNVRLLIYFPEGAMFRRGVEQIRRCYQTERAVYTAKADSLKKGDILVFTTFLVPHSGDTKPEKIVSDLSKVEVYHSGNGYGIKLPTNDGYIQLNAMLDLEAEYLKENVRPRYNFDSGRAEYGDLVTDARYCYLHRRKHKLLYSFFKASKLIFGGEKIFQAQGQVVGQDDGSYRRWGVPKWVAWEDEVPLMNK